MSYTKRPAVAGGHGGGFIRGLFPVRGDGPVEIVRKIVFFSALVCFIIFGSSSVYDLGNDVVQTWKKEQYKLTFGQQLNLPDDEIDRIYKQAGAILPDYVNLYSKNNDFRGWVQIPDTAIDLPVVQSADNEYYLTHDLEHDKSKTGEVFADYRNIFNVNGQPALSGNTILHGHNIFTGTYFATLTRYISMTDMSYYKAPPIVKFNTLYEKSDWKIFSVGLYNTQPEDGVVYDYWNKFEFSSKDDFNEFILNIMDRSVILTDVDVQYGDHILTLSTCYWPLGKEVDTRCVVFARKVRRGESGSVDTSKATYNFNEYRFDEQARRMGTNWHGRVWDTNKLLSLN